LTTVSLSTTAAAPVLDFGAFVASPQAQMFDH